MIKEPATGDDGQRHIEAYLIIIYHNEEHLGGMANCPCKLIESPNAKIAKQGLCQIYHTQILIWVVVS